MQIKIRMKSKDEQINRMWYIHIMEYHSALKRKEFLAHAITWMSLEYIMQVR